MSSVTELLHLVRLEGLEYIACWAEGIRSVIEARLPQAPRPACPYCAAPPARQYVHGWRRRRVAHLPVSEQPCDLLLSFPRLRCQECGRTHTPALPGIARRSRLSSALREFVSFLAVRLGAAVEQLRRWLQLGWNTLWRCVGAAPPPLLDGVRHLCLDEVFYREPRQYLTVLSDADGRVLDVEPGRGEQPSRRLLERLPQAVRERIETLATDLSLGQRRAALSCLPHAEVVADCFHVVRLARRALRDTPSAEHGAARCAVAGLRRVLAGGDGHALACWLDAWRHARGALGTLLKTVNQWELEIESYLTTRRSTGPAEALNRRIALLRRRACGYTNLSNFTRRILLLNCSLHPER